MEETKQTETKKQEVIRLAYYKEFELSGCDKVIFESRFNNIKQYICENGWFEGNLHNVKIDRFDVSGHEIRPKTFNGIDNNSGWISIESEEDLPETDEPQLYVSGKLSEGSFKYRSVPRDYYELHQMYNSKEITHYRKIHVYEPPIF